MTTEPAISDFERFSIDDPDASARANGVLANMKVIAPFASSFSSFIDIGAGTGKMITQLGREHPNARLVAVDVQDEMPKAISQEQLADRIEVLVADTRELPFADKEFDLAILSHVLEHIPDPLPVLLEACRVSRYVYAEIPLETTLGLRAVSVIRGVTGTTVPITPGGHIHHFSERSFLELLARSACSVTGYRTYYPHELLDLIDHRRRITSKLAGTAKGLSRRSVVRILGDDRVAFLYNGFCGAILDCSNPSKSCPQ